MNVTPDLPRRLVAEATGTALLLAIVVGSGIMGERLAGGNVALALLGNTLATGAGLFVLIVVFGPVSGAHFNPVVTLALWQQRRIPTGHALVYIVTQVAGAVLGVWIAHAMFAEPILQVSAKLREEPSQVFAEAVATFGLLLVVLSGPARRLEATAAAVALYITGAYWFTASTSFANPAVTLARSLSDSFAGIAPASVGGFWLGQLAGSLAALLLARWLFRADQ